MTATAPPLGARLTEDVEERDGPRGVRYKARVRSSHPVNGHRESIKRSFESRDAAEAWFEDMREAARTGVDPGLTLAVYVDGRGDRWARRIDPSSTFEPYRLDFDAGSCRRWGTCRCGCSLRV